MVSNTQVNRILTLVLGATIAGLVACSPATHNNESVNTNSADTSIIGGTQVAVVDQISTSTVAIIASVKDLNDQEEQFICTGTLIDTNLVLTAGHCVPTAKQYKEAQVVIVFKTDLNAAQPTDGRAVTAVSVHPQYGQSTDGADLHDVALMKFQGAAPQGYKVAKFLDDESLLKKGTVVTLAGYGLNETDGVNTKSDNTLRKVDVSIIDSLGKNEIVVDQSQGKGACHGDSGGPAFLQVGDTQYVWGVTSRGGGKNGVDDCSLAGVYTKVKAERAYLDKAIASLKGNIKKSRKK